MAVRNYEAAHAYYTFSESIAREERDDDAHAFVLMARSFLHSRLFRPDVARSPLPLAALEGAERLTAQTRSPFLRAAVLMRLAEERASAYGAAGAADVSSTLDRAESALAHAPDTDEGFFGYVNVDRVTGCRGTCAMLLGRPREAIAMLATVVETTPDELTGERSILLADLGAAHAIQGDPEQACLLLTRSMAIGGEGDVNRIGRVQGVRSAYLPAWSDTAAVRDLDERLRAVGA